MEIQRVATKLTGGLQDKSEDSVFEKESVNALWKSVWF